MRRAFRYRAIREYEKKTRKSPYRQMKDATFKDYFQTQTPTFQREWLGATRFQKWTEGKLTTLDQFLNPDTGYKRTLDDLENVIGSKISPREKTKNELADIADSIVDKYSAEQRKEILDYSVPENAAEINRFDRGQITVSAERKYFDNIAAPVFAEIERIRAARETEMRSGK